MRAVVLQSNYLPWKGYFDLIHDCDVFIFYDEANYTKNDWRNRNRIYSPNGLQWLTIPIPRESVHLKISQVRIIDRYWQKKHLKVIRYAYESAPYFVQLEPLLEEFYVRKTWESLTELNHDMIERISRLLGIHTRFLDSKDFELQGGRTSRLLDLLTKVGADEYLTGPSAKEYLNPEEPLFRAKGIRITYKDYSGYPSYRQQSRPFIHQVSILDLLANIKLEEIGSYIWGWREEGQGPRQPSPTEGASAHRS